MFEADLEVRIVSDSNMEFLLHQACRSTGNVANAGRASKPLHVGVALSKTKIQVLLRNDVA